MLAARATRVLSVLVVLGTCTVLALTLLIARHIERATTVENARASWRESVVGMSVGLERQYLQLRSDVAMSLRTGSDFDALRQRWELFHSRVNLLRQSPPVPELQASPQQARLVARIDPIVAAGERALAAAVPSPEDLRVLKAMLDEGAADVQAYTAAASLLTTRKMESQFAAVQQQALLIGALALAQLLLMGLSLQAARAGRRREARDRQALQALNEQLQEAKVQAEAAARAKSQFLANMSHELRTPFQGVIGMLQILRGSPLTPQQGDVVGSALSSARHLLQVLNEVLDVSAIEAGRMTLRPVPFELRRLCSEVESLARLQAQTKGLAMEVELDANLPGWLAGDPMRIKQILFNLLSNAVKFTPSGWIRMVVRSYEIGGSETLLVVEVSDSGIGIEPQALERLFQRFETGDGSLARRHGGTGLGLEISRTLARLMGGDLVARSRPAEGSTFVLTLRLGLVAQQPAHEDSEWLDTMPAPALARRLRVLVADDHPINRQYLQLVLDGLGHQCTQVENGEEAVEVAQTDRFDAVLMDVHMPVMDGLEATRRIRALGGAYARLPIIALSADVVADARERATAAGASAFLAKPVDMEQLRATFAALAQPGATPAPVPAQQQPAGGALLSERFQALRRQLPGDSLAELVRQFVEDDAGALRELQEAAAAGAHEPVKLAAHKYKGSARMLGFDAISAGAERIEDWSRAGGDAAALQQLMRELQDRIAATSADPAVRGTLASLATR